jgi:hypothetical protein
LDADAAGAGRNARGTARGDRLWLSDSRTNVRELVYLLAPKGVMPHWLYRSHAWLKRSARMRLATVRLTLINYCEQAPDPECRVTLSRQRDALGRGVERAGIGTLEERSQYGSELQFTDASHHMGTCMSADVCTGMRTRP